MATTKTSLPVQAESRKSIELLAKGRAEFFSYIWRSVYEGRKEVVQTDNAIGPKLSLEVTATSPHASVKLTLVSGASRVEVLCSSTVTSTENQCFYSSSVIKLNKGESKCLSLMVDSQNSKKKPSIIQEV